MLWFAPVTRVEGGITGLSQALLLVFSCLVLFYWFRYNCTVILRRKVSKDRAHRVAQANQLSFADLADRFDDLDSEGLGSADQALSRDYEVLTCLLRYTSAIQPGGFTFDQRLLMLDFKIQQRWFAVTHRWLGATARHTLQERVNILTHFANTVGKRSAALSRA
ncbi:MAG TPA: hypothetical protein VN428_06140 [Bryobacteraceae bacterium]|nr:hypothetical protein [Bryobacteraceae bacterium]